MEFDNEEKTPSLFKLNIQLPSGFPEKYKEAVINAAELCMVKKTINNQPEFQVITTQK
jgi:ribosomal protein S12 methylthiotransferase accessory factor